MFQYNPANSENVFLGLANYKRMLNDDVFWIALKNTIFFGTVALILNLVITLFLAEIISHLPSKRWKTFFRTVLFIPCIAPVVGTSMVWKHGFIATDGIINQVLKFFGLPAQNWYLLTWPMLVIIAVFTLWADLGYNVVLFSAGVENIPKEFEEAAALDGASAFQRFLHIKLPLMGRTFVFVAIMTMADYFQMFTQFKIFAADGGRNNAAMVLTNYIYNKSFRDFDMGYASALSMGLFVVVFTIAMIQNRLMRIDWGYE
ncbi:MAG: sugar ABC transporter permease [Eubacteriales bacterium]|nr:sugar ABC transporter permease [Eubacteriales bacterium]